MVLAFQHITSPEKTFPVSKKVPTRSEIIEASERLATLTALRPLCGYGQFFVSDANVAARERYEQVLREQLAYESKYYL
jgi:hypothetical protein